MMSKRIFRILLSLLIGVFLFNLVGNLLFPSEMLGSTSGQAIELNSSIPNFDVVYSIYGYLVMSLILVSFIGLFLFKAWGRDLFVSALLLTIPGYFVTVTPPIVSSSIMELTGTFSLILTGFLIAVMYLTPAKEYFFEAPTISAA